MHCDYSQENPLGHDFLAVRKMFEFERQKAKFNRN